jgi:hypothetical protein
MIKKDTLSLGDRILFVRSVVELSKNDGIYEPALYDYAFRITSVALFTDMDVSKMDQNELAKIAFSDETTKMMNEAPRKYILNTLNKACREKIELEREQIMAAYRASVQNEPWAKLVDVLNDVVTKIGDSFDSDKILKAIVANNTSKNADAPTTPALTVVEKE